MTALVSRCTDVNIVAMATVSLKSMGPVAPAVASAVPRPLLMGLCGVQLNYVVMARTTVTPLFEVHKAGQAAVKSSSKTPVR